MYKRENQGEAHGCERGSVAGLHDCQLKRSRDAFEIESDLLLAGAPESEGRFFNGATRRSRTGDLLITNQFYSNHLVVEELLLIDPANGQGGATVH